MNPTLRLASALFLSTFACAALGRAWDAAGHQIVTRLGLAALPADFPEFTRAPAAVERLAFLANVPDRWRNVDPWLKHSGSSWTDHFLDVEQVEMAGLDPRTITSFRYDFALAFAAGRAANAEKFPRVDPAKNADHTREWPGSAPWAIAEWAQRLRSAFSYLKAFEEMGGTPEEIANAKEDIVYTMGILAHYIGDCAQPLHTTDNYNGWYGPNPKGFTKWNGMHSWVDGGLIGKTRITLDELKPRVKPGKEMILGVRADGRDPLFVAAMNYILATHEYVEPLYQLEKDGLLGTPERPVDPKARQFIEDRLLAGGEMLATFWVTAWKSAPVDAYLRAQLAKRQQPEAAK